MTRGVAVLGVDFNVSADGGLVELGSRHVLALDVVGTRSKAVTRIVPAGGDGRSALVTHASRGDGSENDVRK